MGPRRQRTCPLRFPRHSDAGRSKLRSFFPCRFFCIKDFLSFPPKRGAGFKGRNPQLRRRSGFRKTERRFSTELNFKSCNLKRLQRNCRTAGRIIFTEQFLIFPQRFNFRTKRFNFNAQNCNLQPSGKLLFFFKKFIQHRKLLSLRRQFLLRQLFIQKLKQLIPFRRKFLFLPFKRILLLPFKRLLLLRRRQQIKCRQLILRQQQKRRRRRRRKQKLLILKKITYKEYTTTVPPFPRREGAIRKQI